MRELPRFVHKHTVVYRMYTTLKLYYLHQQELLSEILNILRMHMHSKSLAKTIYAYIRRMHGGHYGWVAKITALLKSSMKMTKNQMHSIVSHHRLVYQLHSIIRHAATHSHRMIHKLFHVMKRHGFTHSHHVVRTFHKLITTSRKIHKGISRHIAHIRYLKKMAAKKRAAALKARRARRARKLAAQRKAAAKKRAAAKKAAALKAKKAAAKRKAAAKKRSAKKSKKVVVKGLS